MEEALPAYLVAHLTALIGERVDWLLRPQGEALPSVSLQTISAPPEYHMDGRDDLQGDLVQIDVWASTFASLRQVERALTAALDGPFDAPITEAFIENRRETTEAQDGPDATGSTTFFRASLDVRVWHASVF